MAEPLIQFKHFNFQYQAQSEPTLHDINLTIEKGEKVLIIGPSGSGKSTLAACVNGLIPESYPGEITGELLINGKNVLSEGIFERSETIGTVLQDLDGQFIALTVGEDVAFALENDRKSLAEMTERVREATAKVGMENFLAHEPQALSGGQKQKVSLAGVLVNHQPIFLFDEPLANLDPAAGRDAIALIDELTRENGATTLIIEHRLEDVLYRAVDKVVLMADGKILFIGTADELLAGQQVITEGIREPLILAALRKSGVKLSDKKHLSNLTDIDLTSDDKNQVKAWFSEAVSAEPVHASEKTLSVSHLHFAYEKKQNVLTDINFDLSKGEFVAIVGKNGAGKSTLSKLICGFEKVSDGKIEVAGQNLSDLTITEIARHVGYVMQNPNQMISKALIFDEVALGLRNQVSSELTEADIEEKVHETLKICGLYEMRHWPISALSYGQKKRVTIASILVLEPEILILDEPTAGQDYRHYTEIMTFLESLNARGITIIMVTHDMHLMMEYAKRVLVFSEGRLLADRVPEAVLTDQDLIKAASLKENSLFTLAEQVGITDKMAFIHHFIEEERKERRHG
ncbi:MAG: ABC transporter ATP-binding protein [Streptococcaceae bacterium]|nr:ABC transporter ATP-binding protein [Streptococcaceae bacterium]